VTESTPNMWAGQRLGLPESGPGSLATMPRRIGAIIIDWGIALLISHAFFADNSWATLLIFGGMQLILVGTLGYSFGHRILGLQVIRMGQKLKSGYVGLYKAFVRSLLVCLVIPVSIWDADNRGLHDKAAGTVLIRRS
jgi:uncharacterized RDD family membrane protein YckC